ncbi:MAG: HAMP domain-containing sensor histidine kinase [Pseudomonadota bacterium]|nr:HAMP domain-containing sensor histidine kinase [Pseudomonadota bacterium]
MRVFHLSFRYKIPIWGGALILISVLAVSAALMFKAYEDLKEDVRISAEGLGGILTKTLFAPLLHDDVWLAFEQVNAAFHGRKPGNPIQPELIFVVGPVGQVMVSTAPEELPMLASLESLGPGYAELARALDRPIQEDSISYDPGSARRVFFAFPIREESAQVGTLVLAYSKDVFLPRFRGHALYAALIGALVLAVLLPLNWYWGQRMARPLVDLARRMGRAVHGGEDNTPREIYPYQDELGQLFQAYDAMLVEMRGKALLERELLQSERLTAIGRLASGIAHEVNNPLGGMLMALDTLRERGGLPEHAAKTLGLLERGLRQIQETVAALLVQARDQCRPLTPHDLEDVRTLIHPQVLKKSQHLDWHAELPESVQLPAAACRQILINLLLNAVQATAEQGRIAVEVAARDGGLVFSVVNQAEPISRERMEHLFEPVVAAREGGHGLGLWVTYQIVQQLEGRIGAVCEDGEICFDIWLPLETNQ